MQEYRDPEPDELAADPSFQRWKLTADPEARAFWSEWLIHNPDRQELVEKAALLLTAIHQQYEQVARQHPPISDDEVRHEIGRLRQSLDEAPVKPLRGGLSTNWFTPLRYGVAASVLLLLGLFGWYRLRPTTAPDPQTVTYAELVAVAQETNPLIEVENNETKPLTVALPDRSTIVVYPKSRVSYPKAFAGNKREVYLQGQAFFSVTKNPAKPFYVYANSLVTKVLGTSFTVQTYEKNRQVKVVVSTGRVSVYAASQKPTASPKDETKLTGVVLTPNQQIVFSPTDSRLVKSVVANPVVLKPAVQQQAFRFQRTPMAEVFTALEQAYGIKINYDADLMRTCYLTASLSDEPLFQKLDLICRTVNASYEQVNGDIVVHANGCD
ncbi:FecR domain-containing protein [Fibrella sp. WM1]|uniref:FecR domain-containing protein n=1 Tax=Fibrella musci TaxID=3242485 RepID=UPI003521CBDC